MAPFVEAGRFEDASDMWEENDLGEQLAAAEEFHMALANGEIPATNARVIDVPRPIEQTRPATQWLYAVTLPVALMFFLMQRHFIAGLTLGAVK